MSSFGSLEKFAIFQVLGRIWPCWKGYGGEGMYLSRKSECVDPADGWEATHLCLLHTDYGPARGLRWLTKPFLVKFQEVD